MTTARKPNTDRPTLNLMILKRELATWWADKRLAGEVSKRVSKGAAQLKAQVQSYGLTDEKGSFFLEVGDEVTGIGTLKAQRSVSHRLDEEAAEKILKRKGIWESCVHMEPVYDTDAIYAAFYDKKITKRDIDTIFHDQISYSLVVLDTEGKQIS